MSPLPSLPDVPPEVERPPEESSSRLAETGRGLRGTGMVSAVGFVLVTSILIGYAVGHWADGRFGIEPIGTAVGVLLGSLAGFLEMIQIVTKASRTQ